MRKFRWGILGLGSIANRFMSGLSLVEDAELYMVASRSAEKAVAFQEKYGATHAVTCYEALVNDPAVDIVYIATPHPMHIGHASMALKAGKHVLVEKPACVNGQELAALQALAAEKGCFLMEAMWTRFFPASLKMQAWLQEGRIGSLRQVQAAFAYPSTPEAGPRRIYDPQLAGGALMDVGVYPLSFADMAYDAAPETILAMADYTATGVDALSNYLLRYPGGGCALLSGGISCYQKDTAFLWGDRGSMEIPDFWHPSRILLRTDAGTETFASPVVNEGFQYEIRHVQDCIARGLTESPVMTFARSRRVMAICDEIRRQLGITFPFE